MINHNVHYREGKLNISISFEYVYKEVTVRVNMKAHAQAVNILDNNPK